jgi:hypothetical protein
MGSPAIVRIDDIRASLIKQDGPSGNQDHVAQPQKLAQWWPNWRNWSNWLNYR